MAKRIKGKILDRKKEPRELMLKNLASSVLIYERVKTTEAKAKAVKPLVEKMITLAKKNTFASTRQMISTLPKKMAVKKALEVLKERYKERKGGYTRIIRMGNRAGDGAKVVQLELV